MVVVSRKEAMKGVRHDVAKAEVGGPFPTAPWAAAETRRDVTTTTR